MTGRRGEGRSGQRKDEKEEEREEEKEEREEEKEEGREKSEEEKRGSYKLLRNFSILAHEKNTNTHTIRETYHLRSKVTEDCSFLALFHSFNFVNANHGLISCQKQRTSISI